MSCEAACCYSKLWSTDRSTDKQTNKLDQSMDKQTNSPTDQSIDKQPHSPTDQLTDESWGQTGDLAGVRGANGFYLARCSPLHFCWQQAAFLKFNSAPHSLTHSFSRRLHIKQTMKARGTRSSLNTTVLYILTGDSVFALVAYRAAIVQYRPSFIHLKQFSLPKRREQES